ncbi:hypothetical protein [Acholeplasma hippikon]|uniref:Uncharacterized protein n=1 Tax=Acholeplasma hippikon TaxID=264636 RepID=A0A449BJQ1_9MOLU|nr:hypothetical protein [Acholeplasma hippikon]VEU82696.1 Uncharacterised protein [Acholeplasma hippikon]
MGILKIFKKRNKIVKLTNQQKNDLLQKGLAFSRMGNHEEAHKIYVELYSDDETNSNAFNLLQSSVYTNNLALESKLYEKLKSNQVNTKGEPVELNGPFVRLYYALALCANNRNSECVEIVDYLLNLLSQFKITDSTYLYVRGVPHVGMVRDLINKVFKFNPEALKNYKEKLLLVVDEESRKALLEHYT